MCNQSLFRWVLVATIALLSIQAVAQNPTSPSDRPEQLTEGESLDVRFARAHLRLAKIDLYRFLEQHQQNPNLLSNVVGEELQRHVAIDSEQLRQALLGDEGDLHQIYMRSADVAVELAKRDLQRKQRAYEQFPSETQEWAAKRAEAALEVMKLQAEMTRSKKSAYSSMMYLQWQIDLLRNQLMELQTQVQTLTRG